MRSDSKIKGLLLKAGAGLLTASAAGLVTLPAAVAQEETPQAVEACSAFGTGYFYIPGTETCLRISGRLEIGVEYDNEESPTTEYTLEGRLGFETRGDTDLGPLESRAILRWRPNESLAVLNSGSSSSPTFPYIRLGHVWAGSRAPSNLNFDGGFAPSNTGFRFWRGTGSSDNAAGTLPQVQFGNTTTSGAQSRLFRLGDSNLFFAASVEAESAFTGSTIASGFFSDDAPNVTLALGITPGDSALRVAQVGAIVSPHHSGWGVIAGGDWDVTDDLRVRATGGYLENLLSYVQSGVGATGVFLTVGNDWDISDDLRHRGTISLLLPETANDRHLVSSQFDWTGVPDLAVLFRSTYNSTANADRYRFLLNGTYTGFCDSTRTISSGSSDFVGSQDFAGTTFCESGARFLVETTTDFNESFGYSRHGTLAQVSLGTSLIEDLVAITVFETEFEAAPSFGDFAHDGSTLGLWLFWDIADDLEFSARGRVFFDGSFSYDDSDVRFGLHYSNNFLPNHRWRSDLTVAYAPRLNWDSIEWRNRLDVGTVLNTSLAVDQRVIWHHYPDPSEYANLTEYRLSATLTHQF